MRSSPLSACFKLLLTMLIVLQASRASAETENEAAGTEVALNRFEPAFAGDKMFGVQSAHTPGNPGLYIAVLGDYAHNPLVLRREGDDESIGSIVTSQLFVHLNGTLALWDRVSLNVNAPVAVYQTGDDPAGGGLTFDSPNSAEFGDLRAGLRVRLYGEYFDPLQVAAGGYFWFPTGPSDSYVSDRTVRGQPTVMLGGYATESLVWSLNLGTEFRPNQEIASTSQGSMLRWGAGLGVLLDDAQRLQLGGEYYGGFVFEQVDSRTLNSELLLAARYRVIEDVELGLGTGPGLSSGIGTPDFRAVFMMAYTPMQHRPREEPRDRDGDGIVDAVDACPDVPGVASSDPKRHGCPRDRDGDGIIDDEDACPDTQGVASNDPAKNGCPPDRDGDGIIDDEDACPDTQGVASDDPAKNGCPPDRDGDGIIDDEDACPEIPGVASDDPARNGCPPDTDGDGFRDDQDACPNEKGVDDPDPEKRGCPKFVRVTDKEIVILQQVLFDTAKATIKPESDELIDEVANVLKEHPEILKIRVEGHTDSRGSKAFNTRLSQNRADSVVKALVSRGIDENRLEPKGFGPDVPIADNGTDEGRQRNRRVQFTIIEKKGKKQTKEKGTESTSNDEEPAP